jgi:glycosyltransferase involved in cell wall biosynthesis
LAAWPGDVQIFVAALDSEVPARHSVKWPSGGGEAISMQSEKEKSRPKHIAMYLPAMVPGGVELVFAMLSGSFARRGHRVTLVLGNATGPNLAHVSPEVRIFDLKAPRVRYAMLKLAAFLRRERPDVLLSAMDMSNVTAVLAARLAGRPERVVVSVRNMWSIQLARAPTWQERSLKWFGPWAYRRADAVIAVSDQVADNLAVSAGVPRERIVRIYNPVLPDILRRAEQPLDDPLFAPNAPPVILGIGRLEEQKDFATLIRAFAVLRQRIEVRLVILGDGALRSDLIALAASLGVSDSVSLPGFAKNPYPYLSKAAVFVLSSAWEAFGVVIIEALACGTPVVSTDCPGGPAEILDRGRYGPLVPVGDAVAMADTVQRILASPPSRQMLQVRAAQFDLEATASAYLAVLLGPGHASNVDLRPST